MRGTAVTLLVVGLVAETIGFVIDKSERFGFTEPVITPEYVRGKEGLEKLATSQELTPGEPGFAVITRIYFQRLREINPPESHESIHKIQVERIELRRAFAFNAGAGEIRRPLKFHLSIDDVGDWNFGAVERRLHAVRQADFTRASMVIFAIGALLQILGFLREQNASAA